MTPTRILDTNIVSYRVNRHSLYGTYAPMLKGYRLVIAGQTLAELLAWAELAQWGDNKRRELEHTLSRLDFLFPDRYVCEVWAFVQYARRSQPIAVGDAWIAATALAYDLELVTHNPADFANIPGLTVLSAIP